MRKLTLFLTLGVIFNCVEGQDIVAFEYFINNDPGYGKATRVPTPVGKVVKLETTISLSALSQGLHNVGFRAVDDEGRWSHTIEHPFFVVTRASKNLVAAEYFFNIDPGPGNANALSIEISSGTVTTIIPLNSLGKGFHLLGFRVKDDRNVWSHTNEHMVHIGEPDAGKIITSIEYYYTGGGVSDKRYTYAVPAPSSQVELSFRTDLSQLLPDSSYSLHMVAVTADGSRSNTVSKKFAVNAMVTGVNEVMADGFLLRQNFPNPVTNSTTFSFTLPVHQHVRLTIYDQNGKPLEHLFQGELNPGKHNILKRLGHLPQGIYTVVFQSEKYLVSMKVIR